MKMRGVTITDQDEAKHALAIDLQDILNELDSESRSSQWRITKVEAVGAEAAELHRIADEGVIVPGERLLAISEGIDQTIDGVFEAYRPGSKSPWLRVRAVDSTAFDVESNDDAVLEKMKRAFKNVTELPT